LVDEPEHLHQKKKKSPAVSKASRGRGDHRRTEERGRKAKNANVREKTNKGARLKKENFPFEKEDPSDRDRQSGEKKKNQH